METVTLQTLEKPKKKKIEKIEANRNTLLVGQKWRRRHSSRVQRQKFLTNYTSVDDSAFACMAIARISVFFRVLIFFRWAVLKGVRLATQSTPLGSAPAHIKFRNILRYKKVVRYWNVQRERFLRTRLVVFQSSSEILNSGAKSLRRSAENNEIWNTLKRFDG